MLSARLTKVKGALLFVSCLFPGFFAASCENTGAGLIQGYIEGDFSYISSPIAGKVSAIHVAKGAFVEKGDLLYELDPEPEIYLLGEAKRRLEAAEASLADLKKGLRSTELEELQAALAQAQARFSFSDSEMKRASRLFREGVIDQERFEKFKADRDAAEAMVREIQAKLKTSRLGARADRIKTAEKEVEAARFAVDKAQWRVEQTKVSSPGEALVVDRIYAPGEWAREGSPVIVLLPPGGVKARFFVREEKLSAISPGQRVDVYADGMERPVAGRISYISPYAEYTPPLIYSRENRAKLVFMVEAEFDPAEARKLHPGQPVEVALR